METKRICLWSGPRNISTALMYSFAQRNDTTIVDEPLYGHYLRESGAQHPGRIDVLETMETNGQKVIDEVVLGEYSKTIVFFKQMTHHLINLDFDFILKTINFLLIRDPYEMICSYAKVNTHPTQRDLGILKQRHLYDYLTDNGNIAVLADARIILLHPKEILVKICTALEIPFDEKMLSWKPGARKEDGIWAKYWYSHVHRSSGFIHYKKKNETIPEHLIPLYNECKIHYDYLFERSLQL